MGPGKYHPGAPSGRGALAPPQARETSRELTAFCEFFERGRRKSREERARRCEAPHVNAPPGVPSPASQRLRVRGWQRRTQRLKAPGSFTRRRRKPSGTCAICVTDAIYESGTGSIKQSPSPYRTAGCRSRRGLHEIPLRPSASPFWCRRPLFFGSPIRKLPLEPGAAGRAMEPRQPAPRARHEKRHEQSRSFPRPRAETAATHRGSRKGPGRERRR